MSYANHSCPTIIGKVLMNTPALREKPADRFTNDGKGVPESSGKNGDTGR